MSTSSNSDLKLAILCVVFSVAPPLHYPGTLAKKHLYPMCIRALSGIPTRVPGYRVPGTQVQGTWYPGTRVPPGTHLALQTKRVLCFLGLPGSTLSSQRSLDGFILFARGGNTEKPAKRT
eukprot:156974-Rhodomonas_salina.1